MNRNLVVTILAIIGAVVVFGWLLKVTFALLGPLILLGCGVLLYLALADKKAGR